MRRLFSPSICFHLRSDQHSILQSLSIPFHHHSELHFRCQKRPRACRTNRVSSTSRPFFLTLGTAQDNNVPYCHRNLLLFTFWTCFFDCEGCLEIVLYCHRCTNTNSDHPQSHPHLSFPHHIRDAPPRRRFHHAATFITSCCSGMEETVVKCFKTLQFLFFSASSNVPLSSPIEPLKRHSPSSLISFPSSSTYFAEVFKTLPDFNEALTGETIN